MKNLLMLIYIVCLPYIVTLGLGVELTGNLLILLISIFNFSLCLLYFNK